MSETRAEPSGPRTPADAAMAEPAGDDGQTRSGARPADPLLLEVAWETCNKVGGIYQVLRSKVPSMVDRWSSRYCLVGPYIESSARVEFEESPLAGAVGQAVKQLNELGFEAHYGRWLVSGRPHVVLLNHLSVFEYLHEVKFRLWADHHIPTPPDNELINNVVGFAEMCRLFFSLLAQKESHRRQIAAHFHEWMAGAVIPMLRKENWPGATVFTTHATLLGRYLAMHDDQFYDHLPHYDPAAEAARYRVEPEHNFERSAAHGSHVFTTVSDVTAEECRHLLGRPIDVVLPNGLNIERFAAVHEFQNMHRTYKERIHEFTIGHFFPSYKFDLDNTLYFFTSGRYEYRNKGMDLTLEALARLNWRLKEAGSPVTVVFFVITRAPVKSINVTALQSSAMLKEFRGAAEAIKEQLGERLFRSTAMGEIPDMNTLIDDYWKLRLRRTIHEWQRNEPPLIVTHDLVDDQRDDVLNKLRQCQLFNHHDDPVKVIYHPDFISATNPLFGMEYDQFVRGCHLGVFPSYYEPWGYTPLESIALGVPAITSDTSGFGSYLKQLMPDESGKGVYVIPRRYTDFHGAADALADRMFEVSQMNRRERIEMRNYVEAFSEHFDWHNLGRRYHEAHQLALDRIAAKEA
jgi:glycogen(starch) synthase